MCHSCFSSPISDLETPVAYALTASLPFFRRWKAVILCTQPCTVNAEHSNTKLVIDETRGMKGWAVDWYDSNALRLNRKLEYSAIEASLKAVFGRKPKPYRLASYSAISKIRPTPCHSIPYALIPTQRRFPFTQRDQFIPASLVRSPNRLMFKPT